MIVLLLGDTNGGRDSFYQFASNKNNHLVWVNNMKRFVYHTDLIVNFGGLQDYEIPKDVPNITWSGDHNETLQRIYKTLGRV